MHGARGGRGREEGGLGVGRELEVGGVEVGGDVNVGGEEASGRVGERERVGHVLRSVRRGTVCFLKDD